MNIEVPSAPTARAGRLACPSCRGAMQVLDLHSQRGEALELDLCFACQLLWFDPRENLLLSAASVVQLLRVLHAHRDEGHHSLATRLACPRCASALTEGYDVVKHGRYLTHRCPRGHGRAATFSAFMVEKGFARHLTRPEIEDIAQRVGVIRCASCGAPVDVRREDACSHCRSPLALLDPKAVEAALSGYARTAAQAGTVQPLGLADALIMIERDRERVLREERAERRNRLLGTPGDGAAGTDLFAAGLEMVWRLLR